MNKIIKVLQHGSLIRFNNWLDNETGHLNPVFIAEFDHPVAGNVIAFCKLYNPQGKGLINEIVGFLMAKALKIKQPDYAFVALIPKSELPDLANIAKRKDNKWLKLKNCPDVLPVFCTSRLDGHSAAIHFNSQNQNDLIAPLANDICQWEQYSAAIALDENIAHTDRHLNNLLRLGAKQYAVIDNGILISELTGNWHTDMLIKEKLFTNHLYEIVLNHRSCSKPSETDIQSKSILCSEQHAQDFSMIEKELLFWLNELLPSDEKQAFYDFLSYRTKETSWLLKQRYNTLS